MRCLRIGGLKSYGRHASELLPLIVKRLINLETFDAQGCTHLFDEDFERFTNMLEGSERESQIKHLNLSGCTALKGKFLHHLKGKLPNLTKLELSNLSCIFMDPNHHSNQPDKNASEVGLINFIKTIPKIERIDLEETGKFGGISDSFLDILSRYRSSVDFDLDDQPISRNLMELRLSHAKDITCEGLIKFIKNTPKLQILEVDNTSADQSVLETFIKHNPKGVISLIDCRTISTVFYDKISDSCRTRIGVNQEWEFTPFQYNSKESNNDLITIKTFPSWRDVKIPKDWKEVRDDLDKKFECQAQFDNADEENIGKGKKKEGKKNSWWSNSSNNNVNANGYLEDVWDENHPPRGCSVM
ncbi:uncharacterized protein L201_006369 [Kwoniella dendrophila CBS 6074]|uniref:F-box domain-containing protein n=1 Tax=Kwoniella dendrophila CBS 6074 TaxID=1295534 RepID=A0AAX4K3V1_9TREE